MLLNTNIKRVFRCNITVIISFPVKKIEIYIQLTCYASIYADMLVFIVIIDFTAPVLNELYHSFSHFSYSLWTFKWFHINIFYSIFIIVVSQ